ncbi:unnamed protein product [Anisakis simplex]|uniref:Metalloendopeptidase n=1 Tax=Anisakis simplex TaxID=6269 RepID=A0A0M3JYL6_ANISI|nr:unnamed protein product [Anisakis simplex]
MQLASPCNNAFIFKTSALTESDFINADRLTQADLWNKNAMPIEDVNKHRTDIRGPVANRRRFRRNGVSKPTKLWPNGKIPYAVSPHYTKYERALLAKAVKQYHEKTCVRFVPRQPGQGDYLYIGKVDGCFSEVGRTTGVQVLSLDNGCMEYATIIHEMMHVVGFYHEHADIDISYRFPLVAPENPLPEIIKRKFVIERWDRDNYIDIIWQNIDKGALDQFGKVDLSKTSYYGQPYDYRSILHYDSLAFSKNGFPTMLPKQEGYASTIGNAKDFSETDLAKINRMYGCPERVGDSKSFFRANSTPLYSLTLNKFDGPLHRATYHDENVVISNKEGQKHCEDQITVCWWAQKRCRMSSMKAMMQKYCARTCNFC